MTVSLSLRRIVLALVIVAGIGLSLTSIRGNTDQATAKPAVSPTPTITPRTEDEDRPPIIVSGGSANTWDTYHVKGHGAWKAVTGFDAYELTYTDRKKQVERLRLNLINVENNAEKPACADPTLVHEVFTFILTLTGNSDIRFSISPGGNTQAFFTGAIHTPEAPSIPFWLGIEDPGAHNSPNKKLKLRSISFETTDAEKFNCDFKPHSPILTVFQKIEK